MAMNDAFQTIDGDATALPGAAPSQPAPSAPTSSSSQPSKIPPPALRGASKSAAPRRPQATIPYTAEPTVAPGRLKPKTGSAATKLPSHAGRYDRVAELGRGGWGVVDRVVDRQLERE